MNWAWATSLDHIWRSPAFPMWLTLAAACFFGLILLITLLRAEKSVASGALAVITLLAIGIAVAATIRIYGPGGSAPSEARAEPVLTAALPALSCIDDLAGDTVLSACEKVLFGSPDAVAAAVAYTAGQLTRLTALGDAAAATPRLTPDLKALRKALEHDRYGLVAQVLVARDGCTQFDCAAFRSLTDRQQVAANMDARLYEQLIARYASSWNAPATPPPGAFAALPPSMPTGKPTNAEFPSATSTPAVSIMSPEPSANAAPPAPRAPAAASAAQAAAAKKSPAPKAARAPVHIIPPAAAPAPAPAAADND